MSPLHSCVSATYRPVLISQGTTHIEQWLIPSPATSESMQAVADSRQMCPNAVSDCAVEGSWQTEKEAPQEIRALPYLLFSDLVNVLGHLGAACSAHKICPSNDVLETW